MSLDARTFAIAAHNAAGCSYDNLPFEVHLESVFNVGLEYGNVLACIVGNDNIVEILSRKLDIELTPEDLTKSIKEALWLHDVLEDTSVTYAGVKAYFGLLTAELVYALTNEIGRTRTESVEKTCPKIAELGEAAIFVKLCDRISNLRACKKLEQEGVKYLHMYRLELPIFIKLQDINPDLFDTMWQEILNNLQDFPGKQ